MGKSIAPSKHKIQTQKPVRRQKKSSAPAPPRGPVPQNPVFYVLSLLAGGSAWFAIQQGLVGTLAIFLVALVALVLKRNDWW